MARRDRNCLCCQSQYKYCPTCGNDRMKPVWMSQFCSEECQTLWTTATKYNMEMLTKSEAKAAIEALELKERSVYVECVQKDLKNILDDVDEKSMFASKRIREVVTKENK